MQTICKKGGSTICRYEGLVEAVRVANESGEGARIAYLRINEGADRNQTLQDIFVGNLVGSHLREGSRCVLFTWSWDGRGGLLFAISADDNQAYSHEETARLLKIVRRQLFLIWGSVGLAGLLMCLLLVFIYFGVPLFACACWQLRKGLRRTQFPFPAAEAALKGEGWDLDTVDEVRASANSKG